MSDPDRRELDWQIAMARASREHRADWHWPTIVVVVTAALVTLAAAVLWAW